MREATKLIPPKGGWNLPTPLSYDNDNDNDDDDDDYNDDDGDNFHGKEYP